MNTKNKEEDQGEKLYLGLLIGLIIGVPVTIYGVRFSAEEARTITLFFLVLITLLGVIIFFISKFKKKLLIKIFGPVEATSERIVETFFLSLFNVNDAGKKNNRQQLAKEIAALYSWFTARKWMIGAAIGLIAAFVGLVGSALLYNQNLLLTDQNKKIQGQTELFEENLLLTKSQISLLETQNRKIDVQSFLMEAERHSPARIELIRILGEIENNRREYGESITYIPSQLSTRIAVLTRLFSPYFIIDYSNKGQLPILTSQPLSPERGLILSHLITNDIPTKAILLAKPDFSWADLRGIFVFRNDKKSYLILEKIILNNSFLKGEMNYISFVAAKMERINWNLNMQYGKFIDSALNNSNFKNSILGIPLGESLIDELGPLGVSIIFDGSEMKSVNFENSILHGVSFVGTDLTETSFKNTVLVGIDFDGATLKKVDLEGAVVGFKKDGKFIGEKEIWLNRI